MTAVVQQSLPQMCRVCCGHQRVQLVMWEGHVASTDTTANCPHCSNLADPVPYVELPVRVDTPRGVV